MENGNEHENGTNGTEQVESARATTPLDYSTDFPALPMGAPAAVKPRPAAPTWSRPATASKNATVTLTLNPDERASKGKAFGPTSEEQQRCQGVAQATDTRIELCESKDGSLTIIIKGPRGKIEEARAKVIRELQTQANKEIVIPKEFHRVLIGTQGSTLKALEAETNTKITVPGRDMNSEVIKIVGPRDGIERAAAHIIKVSAEQAKLATENIPISRKFYPWVRGPNNELIDELMSKYAIKVNIPPPTAENEIINISGEREGVLYAAAKIRAIAAEKQATTKTVSCNIARSQHRYIVGKQRNGIADILRETGISVEMPTDVNSDEITLRGDTTRFGDALAMLYERASSTVTSQITVEHWMHRLLIGPKGATLQALVPNRQKLEIDFEDSGAIFFEGSPEEVKAAQAAITAEIARIEREMTMEKVKEECGVSIGIPDEKTNSDEITVEGKKEGVHKAVKEILDLVHKIENEKSKDVIIEHRLHKFLIGQKGENIQKIRAQYPTLNFLFPDVNKKSDIINIRGDKLEVDKAAKQLQTLAKELAEQNYQQSVLIFKEFYKHIVGKGGANLRKIREETQTRIELPEESSNEERVAVTGKKDNVHKAIALLEKLQYDLASVITEELDIPVKVQQRMLGGNRRFISDIEKECGNVHIKFPAEKSNSTKVTIVGPKEDAEKAKKVLSDLAKDREANLAEDTVTAKPEFHSYLIGRKGARINKIRESGVRIMFPRENDEDRETIHLLGSKDEVAKAKAELETLIKQLNETVETKIEVDPKFHGHFRMRSGAVVKEIQEQNGNVIISFPARSAEDQRSVLIKGIKQCVESAKHRIEEIVEDMERHVDIMVEVPSQHHRSLLANRGFKVQEIQSKFNVRIHFPDRRREGDEPVAADEHQNLVHISGRDTACEAAKAALLAMVPLTKVIHMPYEMHGFLIGKSGETIRKIMQDNDVNISVPKDDKNSDEIMVTGTEEAVESALEDIKKKMEEYEAQAEDRKLRSFTLTLNIPVEYHQKIIGTRGATVNALRQKYDVNIVLPRGEEKTDEITIQGYEVNARACGDAIEEMIAEIRSLISQEVHLDARCHPRIIGKMGKSVKKLMEEFGVEIRFPRNEGADPNMITVLGKDEGAVFDCIDRLRSIEEDVIQEQQDKPQYISQRMSEPVRNAPAPVLEIRNAPWQNIDIASAEQFPEMAAAPVIAANTPIGAWGAQRRF